MTDTGPRITVDERGTLRIVTIRNERHRNALTPDMHREFLRIWKELALDGTVAAVVLTGEGGSFCAGGDIDGMLTAIEDEGARRRSIDEARQIVKAIIDCPVPTVAAINGPAVGAGCTFALLCDLALIADDAYFSDPHVNVGLVAGDGGAIVWPLLVGLSRAKQVLFTGDRVDAATALDWGIAVGVHPATEVLDRAISLAERLAAQPSYAVRATKAAVNVPLQQAVAAGLEASLASELASQTSSEFVAIVRGMIQQRDARRERTASQTSQEEGR